MQEPLTFGSQGLGGGPEEARTTDFWARVVGTHFMKQAFITKKDAEVPDEARHKDKAQAQVTYT